MHYLTHPLNHSLTRSLTRRPTHLLPPSLTSIHHCLVRRQEALPHGRARVRQEGGVVHQEVREVSLRAN